jgi:hypothetical protein
MGWIKSKNHPFKLSLNIFLKQAYIMPTRLDHHGAKFALPKPKK